MEPNQFLFGNFCIDLRHGKFFSNGVPMEIKTKAFDILCVLASAQGKLVTKDELMAKVWPGLVVEENNIQVHVSAIRKVLGEDRSDPIHLFTVPGRGYRLVGVQPFASGDSDEAGIAGARRLPDRPSIAVLPFQNMSSDPEQEYFADGVVEDVIAGLSRIKWLFVIARNSSFVYKGRAVDMRQVGHELGVRYVLQGSIRKSGDRVRITAQLVEAHSGTQVWTERYDRLLGDIFEVQDEIAMSVIGAIEPGLRKIEVERVKRKRPEILDAYDLVLQALPFIYKLMPEGSAPAIPLLQKALELEPDYSVAHAVLAWCFHVRFSRGGLHEEDRRFAIHHAHAAVSGASDDATTLAIAAFVIWFDEHDVATAFDLFDRALALSNSNVVALCTSAVALAWTGESELAIKRAQLALKLSPFDSLNYLSYQALAGANFRLERYAEAYASARRAVESNPGFSVPYAYLTAALIRLGRDEDARATAQSMLKLDPGFTISKFSVTVGMNPEVFSAFAEAWRKAGIPE
ncbi:MAG: winged helix-turn-helix domain-containing protein [Burkholderiales bacterium]